MPSPENRATRARNIRELWDALLAPNWTSDDLIYVGKAIYARTPLKKFAPDKFDRILPHLDKVAEILEAKVAPLPADSPEAAPEPPTRPLDLMNPDDARLGREPTGPAASPDSRPATHDHFPTGPRGAKGPGPCPTGPTRPEEKPEGRKE